MKPDEKFIQWLKIVIMITGGIYVIYLLRGIKEAIDLLVMI